MIAGQGTIAMEILRQHQGPIDAVFVAIGGGGLISGVAAYIKAVRPEIRVIGVQMNDSDAMMRSVAAGERVELADVGLFSDGTAVKLVGAETFRLARELVDEYVVVDTDAVCAAIKDVFEDTRSILEPAGALGVAAIKQYVARARRRSGETYVAITCGANMNFDRLRFVAERAEVGEEREALFAVTIPEERGSFRRFCELIGPRAVTEFNYRISDATVAHVFVGLATIDRAESALLARDFVEPRLRRPSTSPTTSSPRSTSATWSAAAARSRRTSASTASSFPERPGRADALSLEHAGGLEHQPLPLPQPGRRLRPHPGRHAGAAGRRGALPRLPRHPRLSVRRRDRATRPTGCSCAEAGRRYWSAKLPGVGRLCGGDGDGPAGGMSRARAASTAASAAIAGCRRLRRRHRRRPAAARPAAGSPTARRPRRHRGRRRHGRAPAAAARRLRRRQRRQLEQHAARALRRADRRRAQADRLQHQIAVEPRADREGLGRLAVDRDQRQAVAGLGLRCASSAAP